METRIRWARGFAGAPLLRWSLLIAALGCACGVKEAMYERTEAGLDLSTVERVVRVGMTQGETELELGPPSFVSHNADKHVEWTYMRFAKDVKLESDGKYRILVFTEGLASLAHKRKLSIIVTFDGLGKLDHVSHRIAVTDLLPG
jgi:hypothetical protein